MEQKPGHRIGRFSRRHDDDPIEVERRAIMERLQRVVSHDVNNTLMGLSGCAELALRKLASTDAAHPYVLEMVDATSRAIELVCQTSALRRAFEAEHQAVLPDEAIRAREVLLRALVGRGLDLAIRTKGTTGIKAELRQMDLVLFALFRHVAAAMPKGAIALESSTSVDADGARRPRLVLELVHGAGEGEARARIRDRLASTEPSSLAIVLEAVGARMQLINPAGEPLRIEIDLVAAVGGDRPVIAPLTGRVVLLVEDDPLVRRSLRAFLEPEGVTVLDAGSAEEALRLARGSGLTIDLLLSDLSLPGQSGLELYHTLQTETCRVPVLFMSGYTAEEALAIGMIEAGQSLLTKPLDGADLASHVRALLTSASR